MATSCDACGERTNEVKSGGKFFLIFVFDLLCAVYLLFGHSLCSEMIA